MKRFSSGFAVVLGFLGVLLGTLLIVGLWLFNARINQSITAFLTPIETLSLSLDERLGALDAQVQFVQEDVIADLLLKTNAIKTAPPDVQIDTTPILEALEARLEPSLAKLQSELLTLTPQLQATLEFLQLARGFLPERVQAVVEANVNEQLASISENAASIKASLEVRKAELSTITVSTDISRIERIEEPIQDLDTHLDNVDALVERLTTVLDVVKTSVVNTKNRITLYLILATLIVTLLSVWALWANFALFKNGRRDWLALG